jgi:hypothetical protein
MLTNKKRKLIFSFWYFENLIIINLTQYSVFYQISYFDLSIPNLRYLILLNLILNFIKMIIKRIVTILHP